METGIGTLSPYKDALNLVIEAGGEPLKLCYQCGNCSSVCPWNLVRSFIVRRLIHEAQLGVISFENDDIWRCATCRNCVQYCPRGVEIIDIMRAVRRAIVSLGLSQVPKGLEISAKNIAYVGNPFGNAPEERANWARDMNIKKADPGIEVLYFPCCIPAYDANLKSVARATASILNALKVNFGISNEQEKCCGEAIRKAGHEETYISLARTNIDFFASINPALVLVSSPHCYHTFKNEYSALGGKFQVMHVTQYLASLLTQGKLKFSRELKKKVIYSDPCYLGRHNGIYDEPRQVLKSIPGLELIEFPESREESICCGGGGGRIWMDTPKKERLSELRISQALDKGANIIAVACPYCNLNYRDGVLSMGKDEVIEVKDIAELVAEAL